MGTKYFPGANTGVGFVSHFEGITPPWEEPDYLYVLKGGPGVGKNTVMRKIRDRAEQAGLTAEEFRCASDPESFDAVRVAEKHLVVLDGTAPHVIDPVLPGAGDEIVNLGCFQNTEEFRGRRGEIAALFAENQKHYAAAYAYLRAARELTRSAVSAAEECVNREGLKELLARVFPSEELQQGGARRLFAKSFTPSGAMNFLTDRSEPGAVRFGGVTGYYAMQEALGLCRNRKREEFTDPVLADTPMALRVWHSGGEQTTLLLWEAEAPEEENFLLKPLPDAACFSRKTARLLEEKAVGELAACKEVHDEIEKIYKSYVNYSEVDKMAEALLKAIGL